MDSLLIEWLEIPIRWLHIVTAIAWIGSSFFFMWLDAHLESPQVARKGVEGELWMTHSGGFYRVEKIHVAPSEMPRTLHWFKWEAAFTWISGILLLAVVYYLGMDLSFVDPALQSLGQLGVIALGIALLVAAWLVYDGLYTSRLARTPFAGLIGVALLVALSYALAQVMTGRAAFIHVGAVLGTLMVANVWMRIIPAQRELVAATKQGRKPDPTLGAKAKQRSIHNNYLTLPVIFTMMSNHFSSAWSHERNWLILVGLGFVGALVRHYFNRRAKGENPVWLWPAAAGLMVALLFLVRG
jgi:uncharacterized membrane protein